MKKYLNILKKCPLFADISDDDLLRMLGCLGARVTLFDKKYTIFSEGSPAKYIGIVLSGAAQIIQIDYDGNRSILSDIRPSEVFAEAFACAGVESLPVSVIADAPSEIMLIDCSHILHTCSNNCGFHQQLIFNLMKDLAIKTTLFHQKIEIISRRTTREKLLTYLSFQSKKEGSTSFTIPFDRQELADYLEVDRSGLSAEISKMKNDGLIKNQKNHFELL
ncbi:MAG: Crp/Fnr family transcriptional regulator [Ruminococcaceae bacterium]|nr:Crp/Fnr family transcriptional regulator [Oscillospiraceae bacterium]